MSDEPKVLTHEMNIKNIAVIPIEKRDICNTQFNEYLNEPPYTIEQWLPYKGKIIHFCVTVPSDGDAKFYLDGTEIDITNIQQ